MPPTLSSQMINALGRRLARAATPSAEDLAALAELQDQYQRASRPLGAVLAELVGDHNVARPSATLAVNSRSKTAGTIIDKVRRGTRLSTMQDIVGFRVSAGDSPSFTLGDQDELARKLSSRLAPTKIVDRRGRPSAGYRAVHVICDQDGFPIEVQVRTYFQDLWANATEAIGDAWGRGLRYGLPPDGSTPEQVLARTRVLDAHKLVSDRMFELEQAIDSIRVSVGDRVSRLGLTERAEVEAEVDRLITETVAPRNDSLLAALAEFRRLAELVT